MYYLSIKNSIFLIVVSAYLFGCKKDAPMPEPNGGTEPVVAAPIYTYEVVATYPHDQGAFTQGLQYADGIIYEGTGLEGSSGVRKVELKTGKVLKETKNDPIYFGEGITVLGTSIYQLTYVTEKGFIYDKESLARTDSFMYQGEGWGLTTDGSSLIMSNGSSRITFINPLTRSISKTIEVYDGIDPVFNLNELEYIKGEIWANIWTTDRIVRIDPTTGKVLGWIDLSALLTASEDGKADVLNGIAYDSATDRIFVTGKLWPKLFEIKIKPKQPA